MNAKYDRLRSVLEAAPAEEPVSLTFDELDRLVGGLPPSALRDRTWWGNTFNRTRSQASSWMHIGRRVVEVRLGEAVAFSPANAAIEPDTRDRSTRTRISSSVPVMDGVAALADVLKRAGYRDVCEAVAARTVFLHPDTVAQTGGRALFSLVRDPARRGVIGELSDGTAVMFDDNTGPTLAFLWAAQRMKGPDVQYNHLWGDPRNPRTYTALWNLCATPAFLAKTTDGSNHPEVVNMLRYRSYDLFGYVPEGEQRPRRPSEYEALAWPDPPDPVSDLEALLRRRLVAAPKSRPAVSAGKIGWIFSDGPDGDIAVGRDVGRPVGGSQSNR